MTYIWMCKDILLYASLGKVKNIKYPVILIERPDVCIIITDHLCLLNTCIITTKHNKTLSWWRHQMETFSALLTLCAGNSPVSGEFPSQRPVTRSFDVFFDLRLYKRLSKHSWGWWFETLSSSLWRHRNVQILWRPVVVEENNKTIRAFHRPFHDWRSGRLSMRSLPMTRLAMIPLRWRHNGDNSVSNHQPHECLLNCLFGRRSK